MLNQNKVILPFTHFAIVSTVRPGQTEDERRGCDEAIFNMAKSYNLSLIRAVGRWQGVDETCYIILGAHADIFGEHMAIWFNQDAYITVWDGHAHLRSKTGPTSFNCTELHGLVRARPEDDSFTLIPGYEPFAWAG